jgi:hypothetical protein
MTDEMTDNVGLTATSKFAFKDPGGGGLALSSTKPVYELKLSFWFASTRIEHPI